MKTLKIFLVISMLFLVYVTFAANDGDGRSESTMNTTTMFSGKVVDKITGEALTGVKIELTGTNLSAYTDFEGNFEIDGVKPGEYSINTSMISYKNLNENVSINNDNNNIQLVIESLN